MAFGKINGFTSV